MRCDNVKKTARCMKDGVLVHALEWCKYHMERNEQWCVMNKCKLITIGKLDPEHNEEVNFH